MSANTPWDADYDIVSPFSLTGLPTGDNDDVPKSSLSPHVQDSDSDDDDACDFILEEPTGDYSDFEYSVADTDSSSSLLVPRFRGRLRANFADSSSTTTTTTTAQPHDFYPRPGWSPHFPAGMNSEGMFLPPRLSPAAAPTPPPPPAPK